jgi:hypothetical protein
VEEYVRLVLDRFGECEEASDGWKTNCPAHNDDTPSLSIGVGEDGHVLLHCFAGCPIEKILAAAGLSMRDLFRPRTKGRGVAKGTQPKARVTDEMVLLLDEVYSLFVRQEACRLEDGHRAHLRARGLSDERINHNGYCSLREVAKDTLAEAVFDRFGPEAAKVPGFYLKDGRLRITGGICGIVVPVRGRHGHIVALKVRTESAGSKYVYLSSARLGGSSPGSPVHFPLGFPSPDQGKHIPTVRVTEGELKADVAMHLDGTPTISVPGVGGWARAVPVLHALDPGEIVLAFDWPEVLTKEPVREATVKLLANLITGKKSFSQKGGISVAVETWDETYKGVDDALWAQRQGKGVDIKILDGDEVLEQLEDMDEHEKAKDEPELEEPLPLDQGPPVPPFPVEVLPDWVRDWVAAVARSTQTPPDLAAMLGLSVCGAAIAGKVRVRVNPDWAEPTNLFTVTALSVGDRKSAVFREAVAPVRAYEKKLEAQAAKVISEMKAERQVLEGRLKKAQKAIEKAADEAKLTGLEAEAKKLIKQLGETRVPDRPLLLCDDETPENLTRLLTTYGRVLQAGPEGTAFEIIKGRYSDRGTAGNFDVYLKGHSGDPLRVGRVTRGREGVDDPALSVALTVQPDVIRGLAEQADLTGRGFLARWLYGVPVSLVGRRKVQPDPVPGAVRQAYHDNVTALWELPAATDEEGNPEPHTLTLTHEASQALNDFMEWLEPQLGEGKELSLLAGWANKLAGAVVRVAAILHVAAAAGQGDKEPWGQPIGEATMRAAIRLGREYLLPHAQAAFGLMGSDPRVPRAKAVLRWVAEQIAGGKVEYVEYVEKGYYRVSRRTLQQHLRGRFKKVEEIDPVLDLLVRYHWLTPTGDGKAGRGNTGPTFHVHPSVRGLLPDPGPGTQPTQPTQPAATQVEEGGGPAAESA